MCGYCTESIMLEHLVETKRQHPHIEIDWLLPNFLQEIDDLTWIINEIKIFDYFEDSLDIIFCRLLDRFIAHGHDSALYDFVESVLGQTLINKFFTKRDSCHKHNFSKKLLNQIKNPSIYENETSWNVFIREDIYLTDTSEKCLKSYSDWGIFGKDENVHDKFISIFPSLFFALSFLSNNKCNSNIIKEIALNPPNRTPSTTGNELWLQRKAFLTCVKKYGLEFIFKNISKIRYELIFYTLTKINFEISGLRELRMLISSQGDQFLLLGYEKMFRLIDDLIMVNGKIDDLNILYPTIPPPILKEYHCPHCNNFLFKGNVQKLNMVCRHCQKMINI